MTFWILLVAGLYLIPFVLFHVFNFILINFLDERKDEDDLLMSLIPGVNIFACSFLISLTFLSYCCKKLKKI